MSQHLGEAVSALADGQLAGADRDRALGHVATCGPCRAELESLRSLKIRVSSLSAPPTSADLTRRLVALSASPSGGGGLGRPAFPGRAPAVGLLRPARSAFAPAPAASRRTRDLLVACLAVGALGAGAGLAATSGGGPDPAGGTGRVVNPTAVQVLQHDSTSRESVLDDPVLPVMAAVARR